MTFTDATLDTLYLEMSDRKWVAILKSKEGASKLAVEGYQAAVLIKAATPGTGFRWIYEKYLPNQQFEDYNVESLTIYPSGETVKGRVIFQGENTVERKLPIEGALALALKRRGRIMVDSDLLR